MSNLPPPGTPLLTITWDTVVAEEWEDDGPDSPPHVVPVTIGDQIIQALTVRLIDEVRREVKNQAVAALAGAVRDQVQHIVAEALMGPIRKTNHYGEPTGEPTTLREMIATQATEFISAKPVRDRGYNSDKTLTFADLLKVEVHDAMANELRETIVQARAQVAEAVKERAGALLGDVINSTAPRR